MSAETTGWQPISTAPKDGTWIEVRTIRSREIERMYWEPTFTSWVDGELQPTGCWTDDDGWLEPGEVDVWRPAGLRSDASPRSDVA